MSGARFHTKCPKGSYWRNTVVNAYVRQGKAWVVIGEVCTACLQFWPKKKATS